LVQPIGPGLTDPLTGTHRYLEEVAIQTCEQLADGSLKVTKNKPFAQQVFCEYFFNFFEKFSVDKSFTYKSSTYRCFTSSKG